jgi:hypothetical protein
MKEAILKEDIRSATFIPIVQDGRLAGKFMGYRGAPYRFCEAEIEAALALARLTRLQPLEIGCGTCASNCGTRHPTTGGNRRVFGREIISKNLQGIIQTWNEGAERVFCSDGKRRSGSRSRC